MPAHGSPNPREEISAVNGSSFYDGSFRIGQLDPHTHTNPDSNPHPSLGPTTLEPDALLNSSAELRRQPALGHCASQPLLLEGFNPRFLTSLGHFWDQSGAEIENGVCMHNVYMYRAGTCVCIYMCVYECVCVWSICRHSETLFDCSYTRWH